MLAKIIDNRDSKSLASRLRLKRNEWFRSRIDHLPRPLRILDIGGRTEVWEAIRFANRPDTEITLLNTADEVTSTTTPYFNIVKTVGDARDLRQYRDQEFDVVYSNSVIEHVGDIEDMRRMATEMRRVGKRYFLQTPNRYSPIEPHFMFPLFQFLPFSVQVYLVQHFKLGWIPREPRRAEAERVVRGIHLLSKRDLRMLFPDSEVVEEKFAGLAK